MRRRQPHEDAESQDRWVLSYADFITLLFAFFVVMYSLSSINEEKYKDISAALTTAFEGLQTGKGILPSEDSIDDLSADTIQPEPVLNSAENRQIEPFNSALIEKIYADLDTRLLPFITSEAVSLSKSELWVSLELPVADTFRGERLTLSATAEEQLQRFATLLRPYETPIHIESYTDNTAPSQSSQYPSNWELSAARSALLARRLMEFGIQPERLAVVGYSEYQPKYSNRTENGREGNQRVVIVVSRDRKIQRSVMAFGVEQYSHENETILLQQPAPKNIATIEQIKNNNGGTVYKQPSDTNRGEL